jgi:acyl carrier protein
MVELTNRVLACANKVAGKSLALPDGEDLALEAFQFDSLSIFAFMVELENEFGVSIDEALLNDQELRTVRSTAAFVASQQGGGTGAAAG